MGVNNNFHLEEELFGSEGGNLREGGVLTRGRKLQQNKLGRGEGNLL